MLAQGAAAVAQEWVAALPDGGKYIELTGKESNTNAGVRSEAFASVVSFDGSPDAVEAIKAGTLLATGLQPAVLISQLAARSAAGRQLHRRWRDE